MVSGFMLQLLLVPLNNYLFIKPTWTRSIFILKNDLCPIFSVLQFFDLTALDTVSNRNLSGPNKVKPSMKLIPRSKKQTVKPSFPESLVDQSNKNGQPR